MLSERRSAKTHMPRSSTRRPAVLRELASVLSQEFASCLRCVEAAAMCTEGAAAGRCQGARGGDPAGSWVEPWFTGTGFPRVFYLRYHLYRLYFPVMAIGRYLAAHGISVDDGAVARVLPKVETAYQ